MLAWYLPYLLAVISGGFLVFAYSPFDIWLVAPLSLFVALRQWQKRSHHSFKIGWLFGLGWFGAGISWVHVSLAQFGGMPLIASLGLMVILCGYLALFPGLALWLTSRYVPQNLWPIGLAAMWFVVENIRSWFLTGFPWLSLGSSQLYSPLNGWIPVIGEAGVSSLLVLLCACFALWPFKKQWPYLLTISMVIILGGFVLNKVHWAEQDKTYNVAMVQGNIEQTIRWVPEQDQPTMDKYLGLTELLWQNDIIVWPEAAIPKIEPNAQNFLNALDQQAFSTHTALITGILNYNYETNEVFNNLIMLGSKTPEQKQREYRYFNNNRYAKHHLLPIGEFVPFENILRKLAPIFDLPNSSFTRGKYTQPNLIANGAHIAPAICFEIVFPRQIRQSLTNNTNMILTVSNDAWFGHSHGPAQHLQLAQIRAKEFGLPVVRATNNGISAFIDETGTVTSRLPQFETATLTSEVISTKGTTPYRQLGDMPMWILIFVIGVWLRVRPFV